RTARSNSAARWARYLWIGRSYGSWGAGATLVFCAAESLAAPTAIKTANPPRSHVAVMTMPRMTVILGPADGLLSSAPPAAGSTTFLCRNHNAAGAHAVRMEPGLGSAARVP